MGTVYIMRHGRAEAGVGKSDSARELTEQGIAALESAASGLAELATSFDLVLTSPLVRAVQTARIICDGLGGAAQPVVTDVLAPGASGEAIVEEIGQHGNPTSVLLVGHMPDVGYLSGFLLGHTRAVVDFSPGTMVRVDLPGHSSVKGIIRWAMTAEQLAILGKG